MFIISIICDYGGGKKKKNFEKTNIDLKKHLLIPFKINSKFKSIWIKQNLLTLRV
jgi:hypothetical protein